MVNLCTVYCNIERKLKEKIQVDQMKSQRRKAVFNSVFSDNFMLNHEILLALSSEDRNNKNKS